MNNIYEQGLDKNQANYSPLSPLTFIERAASVYPKRQAVVYGTIRQTWQQTYERCVQFASALKKSGIKPGDTVAVLIPNIPQMLELHFSIPMSGAVINALNIRLDSGALQFMIQHGEAKILIVDVEYSAVIHRAVEGLDNPPKIITITDSQYSYSSSDVLALTGATDYEDFLVSGDKNEKWCLPDNEWNAIALSYTSGTTGDPKGVVTHHRGAHLNAVSNILAWDMNAYPVYLWTLPMFHCNGWCFPWTITALNGTHVCLRKIDIDIIFDLMVDEGVTHLCGAPIVLSMLTQASNEQKQRLTHKMQIMTAGSAPPPAILEAMEKMNFKVTHTYGLTEVYGPAVVCSWHNEWDALPITDQAELKARQGVRYHMLEKLMVADPETADSDPQPIVSDGKTLGEILFRGNVVMKGYLKNPTANEKSFKNGWFHSGDLAVCHPDGYLEIRDRSKDLIISGGENISSIEIEKVLYRHPSILEVAVIAKQDEKWGEVPCAFVTLKQEAALTEEEVIEYCRDNMARFKVPKAIIFGPLSKTATGKIQKNILRDIANKKID